MYKLLLFSSLTLSLFSCTHRIYREGYSVKKSDYWDCDLPIKDSVPTDNVYKTIGEIRFADCKNSKIKTKEQVMAILKKEGCAIDAEYAIIQSDTLISGEKVCYQCLAKYYTKKTPLKNNPDYKSESNHKALTPAKYALLSVGLGLGITLFFIYTSLY